ncbi:cupin domain-containing protein [Chloroflexota bacterium]
MEIIKISNVKKEETTSKLFEGKVFRQTLVDTGMAKEIRVNLVSFDTGAKNLFHTHTYEQVLYITEGKGIVATEKEEFAVTPGMIIFIPAGERHWHGATKATKFAHLCFNIPGKTNF